MGTDVDLVRRLSEEAFIKGNLAAIDEIVSADFVSHDPPPSAPSTRAGLRGIAEAVRTAFSDRAMEYDDRWPGGRELGHDGNPYGGGIRAPGIRPARARARNRDLAVRERKNRRAMGRHRHGRRRGEGQRALMVSGGSLNWADATAECPDVCPLVNRPATRLFRRHIRRRPHDHPRLSGGGGQGLRLGRISLG